MMSPKFITISFLFIAFLLNSCSDSTSKAEIDKATKILEELRVKSGKDPNAYDKIMFLPSTGCTGCISSAEDFVVNNYVPKRRKDILIVVTGQTSLKDAKLKLGSEVVTYSHVYIDLKNDFNQPPFFQQYPKIVFIESGTVKNVEDVSPEQKVDLLKTL